MESSGGLTYAEMGRFQASAAPDDPKGTSDKALAVVGDNGQPVANPVRDLWVTETALTTALNMSYMAENLAMFGIVVGVALLLAGIGFVHVLALVVLGVRVPRKLEVPAGRDRAGGAVGLAAILTDGPGGAGGASGVACPAGRFRPGGAVMSDPPP